MSGSLLTPTPTPTPGSEAQGPSAAHGRVRLPHWHLENGLYDAGGRRWGNVSAGAGLTTRRAAKRHGTKPRCCRLQPDLIQAEVPSQRSPDVFHLCAETLVERKQRTPAPALCSVPAPLPPLPAGQDGHCGSSQSFLSL